MEYKIKVYIPSQDKFGYITELKNKDTLAISKYIKANDDYGLAKILNKHLHDVGAKNILDKFFILLQLRALNVSNTVALKAKHISGEDAGYTVNLFKFLGLFLEHSKTLPQEYVFKNDKIEIIFNLPSNMYFANFYSLLLDSINSIIIDGEDVIKGKSSKEKFKFILKFKKEFVQELKQFLNNINKQSELYFVKSTEEILVPAIKISYFNNTIFNLIKSLYKTEISYFYNKFYICLTKLGLSYEDYQELSFVETDILLNIYKSANKLK
jgi:hypothetical protein